MQNALRAVIELLERPTHRSDTFADELTETVMRACIMLSKKGEGGCHIARTMSALALEYSSKDSEARYWREQAERYKAQLDEGREQAPQQAGKDVHIHQPGSYHFNKCQLPESHFGLAPSDPSEGLPMAK